MERLILAIKQAEQALTSLQSLMGLTSPGEIERDAAIQRFEFTYEAIWKSAKIYLRTIEGLDAGSPKGVIRACRETGIFTIEEATQALVMVDDRNLTSHTYDRELALEIFSRLPAHTTLLTKWLQALTTKSKEQIN